MKSAVKLVIGFNRNYKMNLFSSSDRGQTDSIRRYLTNRSASGPQKTWNINFEKKAPKCHRGMVLIVLLGADKSVFTECPEMKGMARCSRHYHPTNEWE